MRYYYKAKNNAGFLNLKEPIDEKRADDYIEITEEEFNQQSLVVPQMNPEKWARIEKKNEISQLKSYLSATDYQAIKFAEGELSAEDYAPVKAQRQQWRARINELEAQL